MTRELAARGKLELASASEIAYGEWRAVLAVLRGDEPARSVAARLGLPLDDVFYWLDVYREAGRRALGG